MSSNILQKLLEVVQHQTGVETRLFYDMFSVDENVSIVNPTNVIYIEVDEISLKHDNPDFGYVVDYKIYYHMSMSTGPFLQMIWRLGTMNVSSTAIIKPIRLNHNILYYFATLTARAYLKDDESSIKSISVSQIGMEFNGLKESIIINGKKRTSKS